MRNKRICIISGILIYSLFLLTCGDGSKNSNTDSSTPNIIVSESSIEFPGTFVKNYVDRTLTITNTGKANLKIGQIPNPTSAASSFSITSDTASGNTLTPSESRFLTLRYYPQSQGTSDGTLSIPSNDPDSAVTNVALKGEGYGLNVWIKDVDSSGCPNISLDVTVTDADGAITNLDKNNFEVKLNNQPVTLTTAGGNFAEEPVSVVLAIDFSDSLTKDTNTKKTLIDSAKSLINNLGINMEAAICRFKAGTEFYPSSSPYIRATESQSNKDDLAGYLDSSSYLSEGTSLYNAIYESISLLTTYGSNPKKVVIVFSDGINSVIGGNTLQSAINYAKSNDVSLFSIFYVDLNYYPNATPNIMQQLAQDTGGQYYSSDNINLNQIVTQISLVLDNKYTLQYSGGICSGTIKLEVKVTDSDNNYGVASKTIVLP
jgi:VWFA-related protein